MSIREETLGKLRVWKTQEKCKTDQREFVEVNNLQAAQRKFLFDHSNRLPQEVPEKMQLEQVWAGILEEKDRVNECDPDLWDWQDEVDASLGKLEPEEKLYLEDT